MMPLLSHQLNILKEVGKVLDKLGFMNKSEREEILSQLSRYDINIGIKV